MYLYHPKFSGAQSVSPRTTQLESNFPEQSIGGFGGPLIEPFAVQPYGPQMISDADRKQDLTAAIRDVKKTLSAKDQQRLDKVAFTIARLGTGTDPVKYAGEKENLMFFSASLLKVSLLYATFELRSRLNKLAPTVLWDWKPFYAAVAAAVPSISNGAWNKINISETLRISASTAAGVLTYDIRPRHLVDLEAIFKYQFQDVAARASMHRLGYSYVNGALAAAGFFDPKTRNGIWYANDLGGGWPQFHVPVATGGKSSAAMSTLSMARLLTAMHQGTLIDQASSREMMAIMAGGAAWLTMEAVAKNAGPLSFTTRGAKVGHHPSSDAKVSSVKSEGAFLNRNRVPFVAVWQNYPDANPDLIADAGAIYRVIDLVVKKWP
jgi:hypothetical protein